MPRLFTGLEIPAQVGFLLSLKRGGLPGARWIDRENYHITLRFIGDIDGRTADEVVDRIDRIDRPEFQLSLNGVGSFGSKKPHSIWAGVSAAPELYALQGEIERICQRIGLPPDPRKFTPHVTLARLKASRVEDVVRHYKERLGKPVWLMRRTPETIRGWRSFVSIPVADSPVTKRRSVSCASTNVYIGCNGSCPAERRFLFNHETSLS